MQRKTGNSTLISVWPSAYIVDQALAYVRIRCVHNTIQAGNNAAAGTAASVIVSLRVFLNQELRIAQQVKEPIPFEWQCLRQC